MDIFTSTILVSLIVYIMKLRVTRYAPQNRTLYDGQKPFVSTMSHFVAIKR
jgi:hypothetical protein